MTPGIPAPKPLLAADRIRKTAREMFYRDGIRAVGVDAIVTQAGVTKPSLYRSFSSKDELAATYLRDYDAEFWARFDAACAAHPGDPGRNCWITCPGWASAPCKTVIEAAA